jgi:hypothetical protein
MVRSFGLMDALELEDLERVEELLATGTSPNTNDSEQFGEGWLPIFQAIDRLNQNRIDNYPYDMRLLSALVDAGCDLNVKFRGRTPLQIAIETEFHEAVAILDP